MDVVVLDDKQSSYQDETADAAVAQQSECQNQHTDNPPPCDPRTMRRGLVELAAGKAWQEAEATTGSRVQRID